MPQNVLHLDGVFITPHECLSWSSDQWKQALDAIAAAGMTSVVLQWSSARGGALYRSEIAPPMPGMGVEDIVAALYSAADQAGLSVILGLDAARGLSAIHFAPVEVPATRFARSLLAVLSQAGMSAPPAAIYIPYEWSAPPTQDEASLIAECASFCRRVLPECLVCTSAARPRLPVSGRAWELSQFDPEASKREAELLARWAAAWCGVIERAQLDAVLLRDDAHTRWTTIGTMPPYEALAAACGRTGCELWAQIGLYDLTHRRDDLDPPRHHSARISRLRSQLEVAAPYCDKLFGFSFEHMNPALGLERAKLYEAYLKHCKLTAPAVTFVPPHPPPSAAPDPLLDKAMVIERHLEQRHLLEGQIMTVVDYRYDLNAAQNQWQEDADWLTGLYTGAEAMRFAATGDPDARARARRSFEALCMLSTVSGVPGVVARSFRRTFQGDLGSGRKRWVKQPGEELWWATDISRDQLSGHLFGLAAYHDLVADKAERKLIRRLVSDIVGSVLDHRLQAVDWDGDYTIHGNFWVAPFQALAVLKLAHHITREPRFQQAYREYISPHFFIGHAIRGAAAILDPFYEHYQYDSPAYHLLQYETDPHLVKEFLRALDLLYDDVKDLGNVYLYFVYQTYRPESDAARRGEQELIEYNPDHLYVPNWRRDAEKALAEQEDSMPPQLYETLEHCLSPVAWAREAASFIPMHLRPPMEFMWQYYAGIHTPGRSGGRPHGEHVGYSGVDYLLAYWMGRYHGLLR